MALKPVLHYFKLCLLFLLLLGHVANSAYAIKEILISTYDPVITCSMDDPLNPQLAYGIEVNIMRAAFSMINWTEGVDYFFNCTDFDDQMNAVADTSTRPNLLGAFGGITISQGRLQSGYKFSQPTMTTGLSLLYRLVPQNAFYLRTFTTDYFVLLIFLPLVSGLALYVFEHRKMSIIHYIYHGFTTFFRNDDIVFLGFASRVTGLSLKLLLLITATLYTAFTTNILNFDNSFGGVSSVTDLSGLRISSIEFYKNTLYSVGALYKYFPDAWDSASLLQEINNTGITYLAYDDPIVQYITYTECDLYTVIQNFVKYDFGFMMSGSVSSSDEDLVNLAVTLVFQNKTQQEWIDEYFTTQDIQPCANKLVFMQSYVTIGDVKGLWYMWLAVFGIALAYWLTEVIRRSMQKRRGYYNFVGLRAEADQNTQGKVAAMAATHCAGSISIVNSTRKSLQKNYTATLMAMKIGREPLKKIENLLRIDRDLRVLEPKSPGKKLTLVMVDEMKKKRGFLKNFTRRFSTNFNLPKLATNNEAGRRRKPSDASPIPGRRAGSLSQYAKENRLSVSSKISVATKPFSLSKTDEFARKSQELHSPATVQSKAIRDLMKSAAAAKQAGALTPRRTRILNDLVSPIGGLSSNNKEVKQFTDQIKQIYDVKTPRVDSNMVEAVLQRVLDAEAASKQKVQTNYFEDKDLEFLMSKGSNHPVSLASPASRFINSGKIKGSVELSSFASPTSKNMSPERIPRFSERGGHSKRNLISEIGTDLEAFGATANNFTSTVQLTDEPLLIPKARTPSSNIKEHQLSTKSTPRIIIPKSIYENDQ